MDTIIGGRGKPGDVGLQSRSHPMKEHDLRAQGKNYKHATTIDVLSDDVLLEIFDV